MDDIGFYITATLLKYLW